MCKLKLIILSLLILFSLPSSAGNVILKGIIPEYAGEKLEFLTYSDQITYTETLLCSVVVDSLGNFSCSFETDQTIYVFIHLGAYEAFVFTEPDKEYLLLFPEKKEKRKADILNPYFEPELYHLGVENSSDSELNYQLAWFNHVYTEMFKANAYLINIKSPTFNAVAELNKIDSIFKDYDNPFFQDYKTYTFAAFLQLSNSQKTKSISNNYYLNNKILYKNKAYMELFNQVYDKYLDYFGRTEKGEKIFSDIGKLNSITALKSTLGNDEVLKNDTLKELVILKCLHDEFYDDKISRSALLIVLDSLAQQTNLDEHRLIAQNIRKKVTRLMVGFEPPYFELLDKDSNLITLKNYKGKYVYLGFCVSLSYTCIQEFEMLRKLYERQKQNFEIVIISMDDNLAQMKNFIEKKNYPFTFLYYGNQPDVFKEFDIRAVPTYFFIDKNGKMALSPAATPGENIEYYIFNVMRKNGDI
jgi:peroxiredoxin